MNDNLDTPIDHVSHNMLTQSNKTDIHTINFTLHL